MKKTQVKVGGLYRAKVSGRLTEVRITGKSRYGGWDAVNVLTNRKVRIKSAQRLRGEAQHGKAKKGKAKAAPKAAPRARTLVPDAPTDAKAATGTPKARRAPKRANGKTTCLDAAAKVLKESGKPMTTREMFDAMVAQGYWTSDAPTPYNTLYSAILREMHGKGNNARFTKPERGKFALKP